MSETVPKPLFVDTGAFYAYFDANDENHQRSRTTFGRIRSGDLAYDPLFTSRYVLSELATLLSRRTTNADAVNALGKIRSSDTFNVLPVGAAVFDAAQAQLGRYDDHEISFVDHTSSVLARRYDIEYVFSFDSDFRTLGFTRVPAESDR